MSSTTSLLPLLVILLVNVGVNATTFCDKYTNITGLQASQLLPNITTTVYDTVFTFQSPIVQYFNGSKPPGSHDFTDPVFPNVPRLIMEEFTKRIFNSATGCR